MPVITVPDNTHVDPPCSAREGKHGGLNGLGGSSLQPLPALYTKAFQRRSIVNKHFTEAF